MSAPARRNRSGAAARAAAARVVDAVLRRGETLDASLLRESQGLGEARDRAALNALAYETLRWHYRHQAIINVLLDHPLRAKDAVIGALLSIGLTQLIKSRQPDYAVVSATVEASRLLGRPHLAKLVNATLRRFLRERDALIESVVQDDEARYAHPQWLIDKIRADWPQHWQGILEASQAHPPMWLRVNRRQVTRDEYLRRIEIELGQTATTLPGYDDALCLPRPVPVHELPGFAAGYVSVQDAAAQLAGRLLCPEPGMRVLDACAAPGGKATHLLELSDGQIDLVAVDIDASRLAMLDDNLERLGLVARTVVGDVLDPHCPELEQTFDAILLDAPCSASGVIRRHPDIRFLRRATDIPQLADRQRRMLARLWPLLKPGGRLLYATCSIFPEENDAVVDASLQAHSGAALLRPPSGDFAQTALARPHRGMQLLPSVGGTDGFYYALMIRQASE